MVRTIRWWTSLRGASLPQVGQGAFLGQQRTGMVATWGRMVSMACVLRWGLGEAPHQYAGPNFRCQVPLCRSNKLSASARSVQKNVILVLACAIEWLMAWGSPKGLSPEGTLLISEG